MNQTVYQYVFRRTSLERAHKRVTFKISRHRHCDLVQFLLLVAEIISSPTSTMVTCSMIDVTNGKHVRCMYLLLRGCLPWSILFSSPITTYDQRCPGSQHAAIRWCASAFPLFGVSILSVINGLERNLVIKADVLKGLQSVHRWARLSWCREFMLQLMEISRSTRRVGRGLLC